MLTTRFNSGSPLGVLIAICSLSACSGGGSGEGHDSETGSSGGSPHPEIILNGATGNQTSSSTGGGIIGVNGEPGSCNSLELEASCAGQIYEGEIIPLDMYVMFDQSGSMATVIDDTTGETRFDAVNAAMGAFLTDPRSAGIGIGLGHFGHLPLGETSCDATDYSAPVVPIGRLPDHAGEISAALASLEPTGETPTGAAIRGACSVTDEWKQAHAGSAVVNLLVTDGEPKAPITSKESACDPTLDDAVAAATECAERGVPTYVLGVGPSLGNLDSIANAGATKSAHLVAEDSSEGVLQALNQIRGDAQVPCEIDLTAFGSGSSLDYSSTDVVFMDAACVVTRIGRVDDASACNSGSGGWYFDEQGAERRLVLCEQSCADVREPQVQFFYSVGCAIDTTIR